MSATDMLADAVVSYAEATRDRRVNERLWNDADMTEGDALSFKRALESIRFVPVSKNGCYGLKATAHPALANEVAGIIDAVTRMSGHPESGPIMRTDTAVLYRWQ